MLSVNFNFECDERIEHKTLVGIWFMSCTYAKQHCNQTRYNLIMVTK